MSTYVNLDLFQHQKLVLETRIHSICWYVKDAILGAAPVKHDIKHQQDRAQIESL